MTAAGGFLLASKGYIYFGLLLETLAGISLVIACACILNNYIDRNIDKMMDRTKKRALASGLISVSNAMIYASLLGLAGFTILIKYTNRMTVFLGLIALFVYVAVYGIAKRRSVHGTIVGSIAGALPPVAGYTAVSGRFDHGALIIFLILVFWQMPHFYAIAMYRFKDYKAAGLPVLPVKKGMLATKKQILFYIAAFIITAGMLTVLDYTGYTYLAVVTMLGLFWLYKGMQGFSTKDDAKWARKMFGVSLIVIMGLSVMFWLGAILP